MTKTNRPKISRKKDTIIVKTSEPVWILTKRDLKHLANHAQIEFHMGTEPIDFLLHYFEKVCPIGYKEPVKKRVIRAYPKYWDL